MARRLDGNVVATTIKQELAERVAVLRKHGVTVGLGTLLVGDDAGSQKYVAGKHRDCEEVGIESIREDLPADATFAEIAAAVERLNNNPLCTGFIVQLPLPKGIDENAILSLIDPKKDIDGLHPTNLGWLVLQVKSALSHPLPCTPRGVIELLQYYDIDFAGKEVCVLGRGITVGRSIGLLLSRPELNATVTLCHTGTRNIRECIRRADIVVAAVGQRHFVRPEDIKEDAVLVDVGVSRHFDEQLGKYKIFGDIHPDCYEVASAYTPNPGGVGPMTRAMLLRNVVEIAECSLQS